MTYKRKEIIGDCPKKNRARGHKQALKLYPNIGPCVKCGDKKSERHHIDDNPLNNSPENIMPLCRRCHTLEHGKTFTKEALEKGRAAAAKKRKAITHCKQGHPYSGDNLYITPDGKRVCKKCRYQAKKRYRKRGGRG